MVHGLSIAIIILSILLLATTIWGLQAKTEKYVTYGLVVSRICLYAMIVMTVIATISIFPNSLWLGVIRVIWQFLTLLLLESAFRRKRQTFGSPRVSTMLVGSVIVAICLAF